MSPEMKKIRQEIDYGWDEFKKIISSRKFKSAFGDIYSGDEIRLSNAPKGYQNDHPGAAYLRLKSWIALRDLSDSDLTSKGLIRKTMDTFFSLRPLLDFLNRGLEE
jgi:uncharacterized protein (DUF2461 family)